VEQVGSRKERAMTDWDLITKRIHSAMHVVDKAHTASRQLRENATPETFDNFRAQVGELAENLNQLQTVLYNQKVFAQDELADWLSKAFTSNTSTFHSIPSRNAALHTNKS
jgi:hypothetical protein